MLAEPDKQICWTSEVIICFNVCYMLNEDFSQCWLIFLELNRLKDTEMCFYRRRQRLPWAEHVSNKDVLNKMSIKLTLRVKISKFLRYIMRKEELENLKLRETLSKAGGAEVNSE